MSDFASELHRLDVLKADAKRADDAAKAAASRKVADLVGSHFFQVAKDEIAEMPLGVARYLTGKGLRPNVSGRVVDAWSDDARIHTAKSEPRFAMVRTIRGKPEKGQKTVSLHGTALGTNGVRYDLSGSPKKPVLSPTPFNDDSWYLNPQSQLIREHHRSNGNELAVVDKPVIDDFLASARDELLTLYRTELLDTRKAAHAAYAGRLLVGVPKIVL